MTSCLVCGEVSDGPRCEQHRVHRAPKDRSKHAAYLNRSRWKNFSKKLRKLSPYCEFCGATESLTVDHIVRVADRPEWTYEPDNCRVLCATCNGSISKVSAGPSVEAGIAEKIRVRRERKFKARGDVNQEGAALRPPRQAKFPSHMVGREV